MTPHILFLCGPDAGLASLAEALLAREAGLRATGMGAGWEIKPVPPPLAQVWEETGLGDAPPVARSLAEIPEGSYFDLIIHLCPCPGTPPACGDPERGLPGLVPFDPARCPLADKENPRIPPVRPHPPRPPGGERPDPTPMVPRQGEPGAGTVGPISKPPG